MKVQTTREKHTISKYRHEIQSSLHKTLTHDGNQKPSSKGKTKSIRMCSIMCDEVRNPSEREDTRNNQGPLQDLNGYKLLSMLFLTQSSSLDFSTRETLEFNCYLSDDWNKARGKSKELCPRANVCTLDVVKSVNRNPVITGGMWNLGGECAIRVSEMVEPCLWLQQDHQIWPLLLLPQLSCSGGS